MTILQRIRGINRELAVAHAEVDLDDGPVAVCAALTDAAFLTPRRAKVAWSRGRCPLCFWLLIRSFGLTREETAA